VLAPGNYRVVTDEELIEELSFAAYRRMSTLLYVPARGGQAANIEMMTVDPAELEAAQVRDYDMHGDSRS
jgi:hypothetical protein